MSFNHVVGEFLPAASALPAAAQPGSPASCCRLPAHSLGAASAPRPGHPNRKNGSKWSPRGHRQGGTLDRKKQSLGHGRDAVTGVKHAVDSMPGTSQDCSTQDTDVQPVPPTQHAGVEATVRASYNCFTGNAEQVWLTRAVALSSCVIQTCDRSPGVI